MIILYLWCVHRILKYIYYNLSMSTFNCTVLICNNEHKTNCKGRCEYSRCSQLHSSICWKLHEDATFRALCGRVEAEQWLPRVVAWIPVFDRYPWHVSLGEQRIRRRYSF